MAVSVNYSEHAALNLIDRKIDVSWVERTVDSPDLINTHETDHRLEHLFRRISEKGDRVLHVVFNRNERRVVTAYFDRKMRKRL